MDSRPHSVFREDKYCLVALSTVSLGIFTEMRVRGNAKLSNSITALDSSSDYK